MDPQSVLSKTAKGREEIETRKYKLEQRSRMLLITVNAKLTAAELAAQFARSGDVTPLLDQLLRDGFVEQAAQQKPKPAADPVAQLKRARSELSSALSAALGPDGDAITMKIEGAKTLDELRAYLESRRAMLDTALGKARAPTFWAKVASLL
jgi:hypothetical protein